MTDRKPSSVRKAIRALQAEKEIKYTQALRIWDSLSPEEQAALIERHKQ